MNMTSIRLLLLVAMLSMLPCACALASNDYVLERNQMQAGARLPTAVSPHLKQRARAALAHEHRHPVADNSDAKRKHRPYDQPGAAAQFYIDQRREPGMQNDIPRAWYDTARAQADALSSYSLSLDRFVAPNERTALAPWTALGPGNVGGRTRVLRFRPGTPTTMYLGAAGGGLWRSTDSGTTWAPIGDLLADMAIGAMAIDPVTPDRMFVGTGEGFYGGDAVAGGGIFQSNDGGVTWTLLPATAPSFTGAGGNFRQVTDLVMSPNNNQVLYATTHSGLWRSLDGGATWAQQIDATATSGVSANACTDIAIATTGPNDTVYVACGTFAPTGTNTGIWRSTAANTGVPAWSKRIAPAGGTVTLNRMGRASLAIAPSNQNTIYAVIACSETATTGAGACGDLAGTANDNHFSEGLRAVYRSTDGGTNWTVRYTSTFSDTSVNDSLLTNPFALHCFPQPGFNQGWYDNHIHVDPTNENKVFVGGIDVWRSDDGGATWGTISYWWAQGDLNQYAHADQHSFAFHPNYNGTTENRIYAGNDGGVFVATDAATAARATTGGATFGNNLCPFTTSAQSAYNLAQVKGASWTSLNNGYQVTQFYHGVVYPAGTTYMAGAQDNGTNRRIEASQGINQWNAVSGGDGGYSTVDPANTNNITVEYTGISIDRSTNGGTSFTCGTNGIVNCTTGAASDAGLFINPVSMDPNTGARLWTSGSFMWRSNDQAATWTRANNNALTAGELFAAHAVAPSNSNLVIAGTDLNAAGTTGGRLFRTTIGTTAISTTAWTALGTARPTAGSISSIAFDANSPKVAGVMDPTTAVVYVTYSNFSGDRVWKSSNGGTSWVAIDDANGDGIGRLPAVPVHTLVADPVYPLGQRLYVGTDLGVFITIDSGNTWARENSGFSNTPVEWLVLSNRVAGTRAVDKGLSKDGQFAKAAASGELFAFTHGRSVYKTSLRAAGGFCASTLPAAIPDNNATGVNITLNTSDIVAVGSTLTDFNVTVNATHPTPTQLKATLTHVGTGTTITLFNNGNGCTIANVGALFDDDADYTAAFRCSSVPALSNALTGTVKPVNAMTVFNGLAFTGNWRLNVADLTAGSTGSVTGFCVTPTANTDATVPVTLSYVNAERLSSDRVKVSFETAAEAAVAGFEISASRDGSNAARIASQGDAVSIQAYQRDIPLAAGSFYIRIINADGSAETKGPFSVGVPRGQAQAGQAPARADWHAIALERDAMSAARIRSSRRAITRAVGVTAVNLAVVKDGIQRISFNQLSAAGASGFAGAALEQIALSVAGVGVPIAIQSNDALFNSGDSIEFVGSGLHRPSEAGAAPTASESNYSAAQIYRLSLDPALAQRILPVQTSNATVPGITRVNQIATIEDNKVYAYASPLRDPWAWARVTAFANTPSEAVQSFTLANVDASQSAQVEATVFGGTAFPTGGPDHHAEVYLNNQWIGSATFDGLSAYTLSATLAAGTLAANNTVTLRVPGDNDQAYDVTYLEDIKLSYAHTMSADQGALAFVASEGSGVPIPVAGTASQLDAIMADGFEAPLELCGPDACRNFVIAGLQSSTARVYQGVNGQWFAVPTMPTAGGIAFTIPVSAGQRFEVADASAIHTPDIRALADTAGLTSGPAQYLVIAHPQFAGGLASLISMRQADGLSTKVVSTDALYEAYSYGVTDPNAIKAYVAYAKQALGTQYVVLVGGDTYDYFNDLNLGSISFVPTLYTSNGAYIRYAASDARFADTDDDRVPDIAIGRLPVRTNAELSQLIDKMQTFGASGATGMLFSADQTGDGIDFDAYSDQHLAAAAGPQSRTTAYMDVLGTSGAKAALVNTVNSGSLRYVEYFGHSAPNQWSYAPLLMGGEISAGVFTNTLNPVIVNQLGCWNSFFVDPNGANMAQNLLNAAGGAVASIGPTALTEVSSGHAFGTRFVAQLAPGIRIGDAILNAKQSMLNDGLSSDDIQMLTTLLGDPAMRY